MRVVAPYTTTLLAYSKAWTPGTNGPVKADAVLATLEKDEDLEKVRGQLKGKFVLLQPAPRGEAAVRSAGPSLHRRRPGEAHSRDCRTRGGMRGGRPPQPGQPNPFADMAAQAEFRKKRTAFLVSEGDRGH